MSIEPTIRLCKTGVWRRDGKLGYVFITSQNWDYFFDDYTEGEPDLGPDGSAYYAMYGDSSDWKTATSRSPTCLTEQEAIQRAESLVGPIEWLT
jgi:hypothetical protein